MTEKELIKQAWVHLMRITGNEKVIDFKSISSVQPCYFETVEFLNTLYYMCEDNAKGAFEIIEHVNYQLKKGEELHWILFNLMASGKLYFRPRVLATVPENIVLPYYGCYITDLDSSHIISVFTLHGPQNNIDFIKCENEFLTRLFRTAVCCNILLGFRYSWFRNYHELMRCLKQTFNFDSFISPEEVRSYIGDVDGADVRVDFPWSKGAIFLHFKANERAALQKLKDEELLRIFYLFMISSSNYDLRSACVPTFEWLNNKNSSVKSDSGFNTLKLA